MARPRTQLLSREIILDAALELIDQHQDFTILGIGKHLGVNPSSLYHHLSGGKDEIVNSLRERFYRSIDVKSMKDSRTSWQSRIERWVRTYREAVAQYPAAIPLLIGRVVDDSPTLTVYEALAALLFEAGVPARSQLGIIAMLDALVFGSAIDAGSPEPLWVPTPDGQPKLRAAVASSDAADRVADGLTFGIEAAVRLIEGLIPVPSR
ncbi:TetR/AcrR family transcriptional regulator [Arthrobacter sp. NPDC056886]|uniref:TetR/AcrR family transcriptional regulator n=1 Tax=Arthrobacter sp. NPDC056886 TaxID=3345960 RepID=UPI00366B2462